jgi:uncharacterized Tic20 family protein
MSEDLAKRKLLSALCHGSIFLNATVVSVAVPIIILFVSDDAIVQENAKEALNFHFNMWLYWGIVFILTFILIGIFLGWIVGLINLIMPILAIIKVLSNPSQSYRYPFIFRLL